ncbi:unnamed protein product [Rotaria socialis]|uniref:acid phosphatase n=1 Tax=Rotaria socialis TaxID=392032 RepID=A0A818EXE6_9BILA|nr:unnamed protein product [Rotaria socialis]CAF3415100.1 unnamed protein product [Rotaria socialis]CAF3466097.1 unnamed protein product [Rotaria socialis]CAF3628187.1 unnamed protein product [Rotaria socialis]CAF4165150.1 unnamed protein product [Rotaria socialis]
MLYSVIVILLIFNGYNDARKLIGTHIILRHGERTPSYLYPTDPNDSHFWPNGLGQLTIRGRLEHVTLGQYIRERYSDLLNSTYVASEITIRSSDYDRTLMSAYSNLVGLYPSTKNFELPESFLHSNTWPESLPWQPIPVHTVPKPIDHLMAVSSCGQYEELVEILRKSSRIQRLNDEFRDFFTFLEKHTNQSIADIFIAWDIADTILIEAIYNVAPAWVTPSILRQLRQISDLCFYHLLYSYRINRLRGGPLIRDILNNIEKITTNNEQGRKAKLYFGHDITISAILAFLDVNYVHQPPFASGLFFDLYQQDDNSYAIQLEYLNKTNSQDTQIITLPECLNAMCPLERFIELYEEKLPGDMDKECKSAKTKRTYSRIHHVSFVSES